MGEVETTKTRRERKLMVMDTIRPKLKPTTTVLAMEIEASSRSPRWPAKACAMTFKL